MRGLSVLLLTLSLASLTLSFGGLTQKGCAYHMPQYGEIFGRCDIDNSLCSFGCRKGYCWKQCLNKENECVVNHRGFTYAVNTEGSYIQCQTEQDCIDNKMDFTTDKKCYFKDPVD